MPSREELTRIRDNYLALWGGDLSLADKVVAQDVKLNIDRHPSANGSAPVVVNDIKAFLEFVKFARAGWETFEFKVIHWVAEGHNIAVRWKAEAIMGKDYSAPTTLKPGDPVTWNGTDFLVINDSNLIKEVNIAQDMMELFHVLGMTSVPV
ncbi:snoaL-like domain-containing protein [Purpureocillium lilacinum]|nr:snoaL-like domain-containing protein [Purpureocillium lilacinum]OAQ77689.1 snoaL-like domain-containing protein [Purpureocillium lilacinum]OAQ85309.1 snoaL-like domain-containing protein [Purpureocillium lilacinum]GJN86138.1 hypothetical protein PLIIFM63780_009715 [Purpureocillium lilacinum]